MHHIGISLCAFLTLFWGSFRITGFTRPSADHPRLTIPLADPVEGSYKLKALSVRPGLNYGSSVGEVTDLLAFTIKSGNPCLSTMVVTFRSEGTITTNHTPACNDVLSMGVKLAGHWVRTHDTLVLTDPEGKQTSYTLRARGSSLVLIGKEGLEGLNDGKVHRLTMELNRQ